MTQTMKAWRVHRAGKPSEALRLDEIAIPEPGPGEIRVKTRAAALNYNEVDGCHGRYLTVNPPIPYTLGMEVMGWSTPPGRAPSNESGAG